MTDALTRSSLRKGCRLQARLVVIQPYRPAGDMCAQSRGGPGANPEAADSMKPWQPIHSCAEGDDPEAARMPPPPRWMISFTDVLASAFDARSRGLTLGAWFAHRRPQTIDEVRAWELILRAAWLI